MTSCASKIARVEDYDDGASQVVTGTSRYASTLLPFEDEEDMNHHHPSPEPDHDIQRTMASGSISPITHQPTPNSHDPIEDLPPSAGPAPPAQQPQFIDLNADKPPAAPTPPSGRSRASKTSAKLPPKASRKKGDRPEYYGLGRAMTVPVMPDTKPITAKTRMSRRPTTGWYEAKLDKPELPALPAPESHQPYPRYGALPLPAPDRMHPSHLIHPGAPPSARYDQPYPVHPYQNPIHQPQIARQDTQDPRWPGAPQHSFSSPDTRIGGNEHAPPSTWGSEGDREESRPQDENPHGIICLTSNGGAPPDPNPHGIVCLNPSAGRSSGHSESSHRPDEPHWPDTRQRGHGGLTMNPIPEIGGIRINGPPSHSPQEPPFRVLHQAQGAPSPPARENWPEHPPLGDGHGIVRLRGSETSEPRDDGPYRVPPQPPAPPRNVAGAHASTAPFITLHENGREPQSPQHQTYRQHDQRAGRPIMGRGPDPPAPNYNLPHDRLGPHHYVANSPPVRVARSALHEPPVHRGAVEYMPHQQQTLQSKLSEPAEATSECSGTVESLETTSIWGSGSPDDPPTLEQGHPFLRMKDLALHTVLKVFRAWQNKKRHSGYDGAASAPSHTHDEYSMKRHSRSVRTSSTSYESGGHSSHSGTHPGFNFACPFSIRDPMRYRDCYGYILTSIRDVKQHLSKCHRMPIYCPRCMDVFPDEETRDHHVRTAPCPARPWVRHDGITESQRRQLARKPASNSSREDHWFSLFDILFPGFQSRPQSPYVDPALLRDITMYQKFLMRHGPRILSDILTRHGTVTWSLPNEERDLAAFQRRIFDEGLRNIFDRWADDHGVAPTTTGSQWHSTSSGDLSTGLQTPSSAGSFAIGGYRRGYVGERDGVRVRGEFGEEVDEFAEMEVAMAQADGEELMRMFLGKRAGAVTRYAGPGRALYQH